MHIIVREGTQTHLVRHMSTREEILDSKMDASDAETQEVLFSDGIFGHNQEFIRFN
jgi:hypothetical protein